MLVSLEAAWGQSHSCCMPRLRSARELSSHPLPLPWPGKEVEELHRFLAAEGYLSAHDAASSQFYSVKTARAVATWQRDNGVLAAERLGDFGHLSRQAYLDMLVSHCLRGRLCCCATASPHHTTPAS